MNHPDPRIQALVDETLAAIGRGELEPEPLPEWWEPRRAGEMTPEFLGRVLDAAGLHELAGKARLGHFDDWHAPAEVSDGFELMHLVADLRDVMGAGWPNTAKGRESLERIMAIENAVRRGVFDATKAEGDRWAASKDGQETLAELLPRVGRNAPCPCGSGLKFKRCHGR